MLHRLGRDRLVNAFDPTIPPALTIEPGDRVVFETLDSWSGRLRRPEDIDRVAMDPAFANPATGPVCVRGVKDGDALAVRVESIRLQPPGLAKIVPSGGILAGSLRAPRLHFVDVQDDEVVFPPELGSLRLPVRPMIGVIGTAPAAGRVPTLHPGDHGGNMDLRPIAPGATVYLPVRVPGGLLALGDCHAGMGDGELSGAGLDINTETTVTVDVVPGVALARPVVENEDAWITYGRASGVAEAIRMATRAMVDLLARHLAIAREEAFILVSAAGDARPGQSAAIPGVEETAYLVFPRPNGASLRDVLRS